MYQRSRQMDMKTQETEWTISLQEEEEKDERLPEN
jgi:hypothetical protein